MDNHGLSIYDLITKLCERMLISSGKKPIKENVKKLRVLSYEILLGKRISSNFGLNLLEDNKDPICNLLAWQVILVHTYKLPEHSKKIEKCLDILEKSGAIKNDVVRSILFFLIQLRNPPEIDSGISACSLLSNNSCIKYRVFNEHSFHLNLPPICSGAKYNNSSFYLNPPPHLSSSCPNKINNNINHNCEACMRIQSRSNVSSCSLLKDFGESKDFIDVKSRQEFENHSIQNDDKFKDPTAIWDLAAKTVFPINRTWESLGNPCPEKEKYFLTEAPSKIISVYHEYIRGNEAFFLEDRNIKINKIIDRESFIKHLRLLLVGITSDSFDLNSNNGMYLIENVTVEGISREALEKYTEDLVFSGTVYRILNNFCQIEKQGFILKAFCNSLRDYLSFYRVATFTISEKMGLLKISNNIKPLYEHLKNLFSICQIDKFKNGAKFPKSVGLLNDLYTRLNEYPTKEVGMVLCSSFFTCVQDYFG